MAMERDLPSESGETGLKPHYPLWEEKDRQEEEEEEKKTKSHESRKKGGGGGSDKYTNECTVL